MPAEPTISLLVPCHNAAGYLPRLMEAVRNQTRPFHEVVCYDDHSTDDTAGVASALGARVLRAQAPSAGPGPARNHLAAAATGAWLHFHDADDLISEHYAESLTPACGQSDAVFCDADWLDETSRRHVIAWRYEDGDLQRDPVGYLIEHPVGINNGLFRKSLFQAVGGFNPALRMWEDADLYVRLAAAGARMRHIPGVWTWSLRHTDSLSHNYAENWNWRVDALDHYASAFPAAAAAIGREAERAADELLNYGDVAGAKRAIAICRRVNHPVPSGGGIAVAVARAMFPALVLLQLRRARRRARA